MRNRIKEVREAQHISQKDFALALGVDRTTVYRWESFQLDPTLDQLKAIARILKTSPGVLVPEMTTIPAPLPEEVCNA